MHSAGQRVSRPRPGVAQAAHSCVRQHARERRPQTVQGYNMIAWTAEGMTYWAVSDLNLEELQMFARLFRAAPA